MTNNSRKYLVFIGTICAIPLLLWGLNVLITGGYFGPVIQDIYETGRDASGIFWTDIDSGKSGGLD